MISARSTDLAIKEEYITKYITKVQGVILINIFTDNTFGGIKPSCTNDIIGATAGANGSTTYTISLTVLLVLQMSLVVRKPVFVYAKTKTKISCAVTAADQRLCFRYTDSAILLLTKSEISSL